MVETLVAKTAKSKKESFTFLAPKAGTVQLAGNFTEWDKHPIKMRKLKDGAWKAEVALGPGVYEYRFLVDGQWRDDETCPTRRPNAFGGQNCIREIK